MSEGKRDNYMEKKESFMDVSEIEEKFLESEEKVKSI